MTQPPEQPDRREPASPGSHKNFFRSLFDSSFENLVTPKLVEQFFDFVLIVGTIAFCGLVIVSFRQSEGVTARVFLVVLSPIVWLLGIILIRVYLELVIVIFKISSDIKDIRHNGTVNR